jgi:hypothetical protein
MSRRKQNRKYMSLLYVRKIFSPILILVFLLDSNYITYFLIRPELRIRSANDQKYQQRCNRYFYFLSWRNNSLVGQDLLIIEAQWSHSFRHTTFRRTPLDECSVRCRDLYMTTHNIARHRHPRTQRGSYSPIPANGRPQT